jgi:hypothetical protein
LTFDAFLNQEGKKIWGDIFPDGRIPVLSPQRHHADLGGKRTFCYMVAWDDLTPCQRGQIINKLADLFHGTTQDVENRILKDGLPLRADLVGSVAIPRKYF